MSSQHGFVLVVAFALLTMATASTLSDFGAFDTVGPGLFPSEFSQLPYRFAYRPRLVQSRYRGQLVPATVVHSVADLLPHWSIRRDQRGIW